MYRVCLFSCVLAILPGCGVVDTILEQLVESLQNRTAETGSAKLIPFESEQDLADYFSGQVNSRNNSLFAFRGDLVAGGRVFLESGSSDATATPSSSPGSDSTSPAVDGNFSQTTIQIEGVDEPDVVKTDGSHIFIINRGTLRIIDVSDPEQLTELATVQLEGTGRNIFLHDNKVIALTETGLFYGGGVVFLDGVRGTAASPRDAGGTGEDMGSAESGFAPMPSFSRPQTFVTVIDVSAPDAPVVLSTTSFEGTSSASRMIDGVLHLVVANFQNFFFDVIPRLGLPSFEPTPIDASVILPRFERLDAAGEAIDSGPLLTWREMFRPTDPDGFGVVSLVSLDVDADAAFTAVGIVAKPGLVFSSLTAMYLTDTEFNFFRETRDTTDIYKFDYVGRGAVPVATGSVPGRVLNQFSMDEHAGHLRVATTTTDPRGFRFAPVNNVFVLAEVDGELNIVGRITNLAPGEQIQSARFMGDRGYLVTFQQVDPLFTLDLSDPVDPKVAGQLKVPGFSTFIVPIDQDHLLTVGQFISDTDPFAPRGVQLSIFDVTRFDQPQQTAVAVLGQGTGAFSEALNDPKAFTYFAQRGLIALPLSISDNRVFIDGVVDGTVTENQTGTDPDMTVDQPAEPAGVTAPDLLGGFDGVVVFRMDIDTGFEELGRISTRLSDIGFSFSSFTRGLIIGDNAFAVTNNIIRGGALTDLTSQPFELILDSPQSLPIALR